MITNLVNPAQTLPFRTASSVTTFSTDASGPIVNQVNASANAANLTAVSSIAGFVTGNFVTVDNAGTGGNKPWITCIQYQPSGLNIPASFPAARVAVSAQNATQWERIETKFKAATVLLENLTTGEKWTQNDLLNPNGAAKTAGSGAPATITTNGIMNRTNAIFIHPDLLAPSCNFRLTLTYNYVAKV